MLNLDMATDFAEIKQDSVLKPNKWYHTYLILKRFTYAIFIPEIYNGVRSLMVAFAGNPRDHLKLTDG